MQTLGDRIRAARRAKRWSQARLAASLGVTPSAVGHWERPKGYQPSSENLVGIAIHLSVNLEWLAVGRGEMRPDGPSSSMEDIISLSEEEKVLLKRYQGLPSPSRALLVQLIDVLTPSS